MANIERPFWKQRIEEAWKRRSLVWLSGVRRVGKTTLVKLFPETTYLNCDLPSVHRLLESPESFYQSVETKTVIFDEIHQLSDPARILKIGTDEFKQIRLLASGSSTLSTSQKFSDSLTDRKRNVHLVPLLPEECESFGARDILKRIYFGGLPPALISPKYDSEFYAEWQDSFFARDIQELFHVEKRLPFLNVLEWVLRNNGQMIEATELAKVAGISRPTVIRYLEILEMTQAITILRPFHAGGAQELVKQPKIYGFDTGFICFAKGWSEVRPEDAGRLIENLTLESLQAINKVRKIFYWRTKQQKEIDFVVAENKNQIHAIECKWRGSEFNSDAIKSFRQDYPNGLNWVVSNDAAKVYERETKEGLKIKYAPIQKFREAFENSLQ
jgi:predicted AAA+ superfamily ATPase